MIRRPSAGVALAAALVWIAGRAATAGAQDAAPAQQAPEPAAAGAQPSGAPATEPDRASSRALERTLVERGGLLLAPGRFELVPGMSYALFEDEPGLDRNAEVVRAMRRVFQGTLALRLGFPGRLQAEGDLPFVYAQQATDAQRAASTGATQSGMGDIRLGLTWHALRGRDPIPDLLLNAFWKSRTGRSPFDREPVDVPLGSGFEQAGGGISLVKALDPIVLLASVTGAVNVPRPLTIGWLDPGPELGISTTAILAVSPDTALSFGLEQLYANRVRLGRVPIPGTSRAGAVFSVGVSTKVSRSGFLDFTLGMGLTSDVPRFQIAVAAPMQF